MIIHTVFRRINGREKQLENMVSALTKYETDEAALAAWMTAAERRLEQLQALAATDGAEDDEKLQKMHKVRGVERMRNL